MRKIFIAAVFALVMAGGSAQAATQSIDAVLQPAVALSAAQAGPTRGAVSVTSNAAYEVVLDALVPGGGTVLVDHVSPDGTSPVEYRAPLLTRAATGEGSNRFDYLVRDARATLILIYTASAAL